MIAVEEIDSRIESAQVFGLTGPQIAEDLKSQGVGAQQVLQALRQAGYFVQEEKQNKRTTRLYISNDPTNEGDIPRNPKNFLPFVEWKAC